MNPVYKAFLARWPLIAAAFLVAFPIVVLCSRGVRQVFGGLFDLSGTLQFFWATWFAYLLSWSIIVVLRITLLYGPERVGFARRKEVRFVETDVSAKILFFIGLLLPVSFLVASFKISGGLNSERILGAFAGFLTALLIVFVADIIQRTFNVFHGDRSDTAKRLLFPFGNPAGVRAEESKWWTRIFDGKWATALVKKMKSIDPKFGQGYLRRSNEQVSIYPGHVLAISILMIFLVIYLSGLAFWNSPIKDKNELPMDLGITTLTYVFVLATLILFVISAAAFLLDRYRVPPILILLFVVFFSNPEHRYHTTPLAQDTRPSPEKVFRDRQGDPFIILVSAIGGGIQTSAWATEVLTGLDEACRRLQIDCANRIALISGVSGGSVGAMYFMERYREDDQQDPSSLDALNSRIREYASSSSLEFVGGSIVFDDLPRQIPGASWPLDKDRGQHLARGWLYNQARINVEKNVQKELLTGDTSLSQWDPPRPSKLDENPKRRPAFIFGTTVVETGERILISTASLSKDALKPHAARSLDDLAGVPVDMNISEAVRLSAAFAYVSPAARMASLVEGQESDATNFHLVDGGYHDNPGLLAVRDFISGGLRGLGNCRPRIAVIQIAGEKPLEEKPQEKKKLLELNWWKQAVAPLNAFWTVTWTVQSTRTAAAEREILQIAKEQLQYTESNLKFFPFYYESKDGAPLSWHLTDEEKRLIRKSGQEAFRENSPEWVKLRKFLQGE